MLCLVAVKADAQPTLSYALYQTSKNKLLIVTNAANPQIYLRDDRVVYLLSGNAGSWQLRQVSPEDATSLTATHADELLSYDLNTVLYLQQGKEYFRLTQVQGNFTQSSPIQANAFQLIVGDPVKKIESTPVAAPAPRLAAASPAQASAASAGSPVGTHSPVPACVSSWPSNADGNQAFGGMFYGVPVHGESIGYSRQFGYQGSYRFRAEHTGTIDEVSVLNRLYQSGEGGEWQNILAQKNGDVAAALTLMRDAGSHRGDGGIIHIEIHPDNGEGVPSDTVLASGMRDYRPVGMHPDKLGDLDGMEYSAGTHYDAFPAVKLDRLARLEAGKLYHIVFTQKSAATGLVGLVGNYTRAPLNPVGGPYFGCSYAAMWRNTATSQWEYDPRLLPVYTLHYADGVVAGQATVGRASLEQPISGAASVRQVFTVKGNGRDVNGFYIRMRRQLGTGPLFVSLVSGKIQVASLAVPATSIPQRPANDPTALGWTYLAFPKFVALQAGATYTLTLSTDTATQYYIGVSEAINNSTRENAWMWGDTLSHAENTMDGRTWSPWSYGSTDIARKATARPNADLPLFFTLDNRPGFLK